VPPNIQRHLSEHLAKSCGNFYSSFLLLLFVFNSQVMSKINNKSPVDHRRHRHRNHRRFGHILFIFQKPAIRLFCCYNYQYYYYYFHVIIISIGCVCVAILIHISKPLDNLEFYSFKMHPKLNQLFILLR